MRHVTVGCDQQALMKTPVFRTLGGPDGQFTRAPAAGDEGHLLWDICANLSFVTKVLIRKRFRRLPPKQWLTNLET